MLHSVERQVRNLEARGSTPLCSTKKKDSLLAVLLFLRSLRQDHPRLFLFALSRTTAAKATTTAPPIIQGRARSNERVVSEFAFAPSLISVSEPVAEKVTATSLEVTSASVGTGGAMGDEPLPGASEEHFSSDSAFMLSRISLQRSAYEESTVESLEEENKPGMASIYGILCNEQHITFNY